MATQRAAMGRQLDVEERSGRFAGEHVRERLLAGIPVEERRLRLAGVSTAVVEGGDGPPVVLLHGPGASAAHWMRVIPALVTTHRVVAPDLPGQGASGVAGGLLDAERVLAWLGELIERTCSSPPALVGNTLGGAIAARFAAHQGDRLSRLVLVDALGLAPFEPAPEFGRALQEFLAQPTERTHDGLWRYCALDLDGLRERMDERWEPFRAYNVASGAVRAVGEMATELAAACGGPAPVVTGRYRLGDVRHVTGDPSRACSELGFVAGVPFADGVREFATAALRGR